jgi:hypothetical protein
MFSNFSKVEAPSAAVSTAIAGVVPASFSDLVVPAIGKLIDPEVSAVGVAQELIAAAGGSAGSVAADAAVPDGIEAIAKLLGADGLLAKYGPGRAAAAVTTPIIEKLVSAPIMKGCMAVIAKHSALLSLAITGLTALQVGVVAAAGIAAGYAVYRFFKGRESTPTEPAPA